jgi:hypothetical protein
MDYLRLFEALLCKNADAARTDILNPSLEQPFLSACPPERGQLPCSQHRGKANAR